MRDELSGGSEMLATLSWLLLPAAVSLAMAQDGYNLYKDIQRGKVDELQRFITDETYQIDHTALTWPSAGARLQMPNSAKRTMNRFKNLKLQKNAEEEDESEEDESHVKDESQANTSEEGDEEQSTTRILIPRTHVLLREEPLKPKRGAVMWGVQLARATMQPLNRDIFWMLKANRFSSSSSAFKPLLFSFEKCKVLKSHFAEYYKCG